jgi:hypothetical protein
MNLKLKAALISIGVMGSAFLTGLILSQFPTWVVGVIAIVFALGIVYNLALAGLKFDQAVEKMNEKYQK